MPSVLRITDLTLRHGPRTAVRSLSLQVAAGEVYGLLGPNGAGKSSTLSAIAGHLPPAEGEILVGGLSERSQPREYRRQIGLVPQDLAVYPTLTASQNLAFFGRLYGLSGRGLAQRTEEVLEVARLRGHESQAVGTFSGGMQRRLNLACALMHRPALLLLDEPTAGLDIQSRDVLFESLRQLASEGAALVFTTHHLDEAERLCSRVGILSSGEMVAEGTVASLCSRQKWREDGPHRLERLYRLHTGGEAVAA
jgi:ABC-2 type transport system ATP-binding protein